MTTLSTRWHSLRRETSELRKFFLPSKFEPTGVYHDRYHERAKGFRLLAHAEIEAYFEDRLQELVFQSKRAWDHERDTNKTIVALGAMCHVGKESPPKEFEPSDNLDERIKKSVNFFKNLIDHNHGIRNHNLIPLLQMAGLEVSDVDPVLLNDLDSFGSSRGNVAHQSRQRITALVDPKNEWTLVQSIVSRLKNVDRTISSMMI